MPQLRLDPIVSRWTLVEVDHSLSAQQYPQETRQVQHKDVCPFCPGRESFTTLEVQALRPAGSQPNTPGWTVRTIPNKFPALVNQGNLEKEGLGIYDLMSGIGAHEIIIETPDHDKQLVDLSTEEMANVVQQYHKRFVALSADKRFKYVAMFKNFGTSAGASVHHAHGQMLALPIVPKTVLEEIHGGQHYHEHHARCVFCDVINQEYADRERIVAENNDFIAFCPFAPRYAFETWIMPKVHSHDFGAATPQLLASCAAILQDVLKRMKKTLGDPSYNFYLHTSPNGWGQLPYYHWHIEVMPKLTRSVGFEWATGLHIVPTDPAKAANQLRAS